MEIKALEGDILSLTSEPGFQDAIRVLGKKTTILMQCLENTELLILRGHIAAEFFLNELIKRYLPNEGAIKLNEFSFAKKLAIVDSFSVIDADVIGFIKKLNSLRNKCAHTLEYRISDIDVNGLGNLLPQKVYDNAKSKDINLTTMNLLSSVLVDLAFVTYTLKKNPSTII